MPRERRHEPSAAEHAFWREYRAELAAQARRGMTSDEVLRIPHSPGTHWT